jgi:hypothetical protein
LPAGAETRSACDGEGLRAAARSLLPETEIPQDPFRLRSQLELLDVDWSGGFAFHGPDRAKEIREALKRVARTYSDRGLVSPDEAKKIVLDGLDELLPNSWHLFGIERARPGATPEEAFRRWVTGSDPTELGVVLQAHGRLVAKERRGNRVRLPLERDLSPEHLDAAGEYPGLMEGYDNVVEAGRALLDPAVTDLDRQRFFVEFFGAAANPLPGAPVERIKVVASAHNEKLLRHWEGWGFRRASGKLNLRYGGHAWLIEADATSLRAAIDRRTRELMGSYFTEREAALRRPRPPATISPGLPLLEDWDPFSDTKLFSVVAGPDGGLQARLARPGAAPSTGSVTGHYQVLSSTFPHGNGEVRVAQVELDARFASGPVKRRRLRFHLPVFEGALEARWQGEPNIRLIASRDAIRHAHRGGSKGEPEHLRMPIRETLLFPGDVQRQALLPMRDFFRRFPTQVSDDGGAWRDYEPFMGPDALFVHSRLFRERAGGYRARAFSDDGAGPDARGVLKGIDVARDVGIVLDGQQDWRETLKALGIHPR